MTMNSPTFPAPDSKADNPFDAAPAAVGDGVTTPLTPNAPLTEQETKAYDASDKGKKVKAWIEDEYRKAKQARRPYERQWYLNLAFYSGKQYVQWDSATPGAPGTDKLIPQQQTDRNTPRLTINKIQPIVRTEQSKLTGQKPSATVTPASNDDADLFAAQAGEQVWESLYERLDFPAKLSRATFWLSITGTSYIKCFWDPALFDNINKLYGDINWLPLSPWNILVPDLLEPEIENQAWVMDIQTRPVEWVNENFGDLFPKGVQPSVKASAEILEAAGLGVNDDNQPDSVLVKEVWIKANSCSAMPDGGMVIVIENVIIAAAIHGNPYDHNQTPFAKLEHIPTGNYYSMSTIEPLIPLQREYNRTQSQIVEAKNRMAKPQMMFRDGSMDPSKVTTAPGLWIPIKGTAQYPQPVPLTELPSYVVQFNDRMENDFENISGQHASTRGEAPAGTAATAIAYLQEQDDAYLAPTFQSLNRAINKVARQSLVLASTYWTVPRLIKATGEDGAYDAMTLRGSEIANSTDIHIDEASALPLSKSAQVAQVNDWMKMGWVSPDDGFELLDMPMLQAWTNKRKIDKKAAQVENIEFRKMTAEDIQANEDAYMQQQEQLMLANQPLPPDPYATPDGQPITADTVDPGIDPSGTDPAGGASVDAMTPPAAPGPVMPPEAAAPVGNAMPMADLNSGQPLEAPLLVPVNEWDDHAVHIMIHNLMRKSPNYKLVDPAVKAEVQKHVAAHLMALAGQQQPAPMAGGAPAGAGSIPQGAVEGISDALDNPAGPPQPPQQ